VLFRHPTARGLLARGDDMADIAPLDLEVSSRLAYDAALALVTKRKWAISQSRAPTLARRDFRAWPRK